MDWTRFLSFDDLVWLRSHLRALGADPDLIRETDWGVERADTVQFPGDE